MLGIHASEYLDRQNKGTTGKISVSCTCHGGVQKTGKSHQRCKGQVEELLLSLPGASHWPLFFGTTKNFHLLSFWFWTFDSSRFYLQKNHTERFPHRKIPHTETYKCTHTKKIENKIDFAFWVVCEETNFFRLLHSYISSLTMLVSIGALKERVPFQPKMLSHSFFIFFRNNFQYATLFLKFFLLLRVGLGSFLGYKALG